MCQGLKHMVYHRVEVNVAGTDEAEVAVLLFFFGSIGVEGINLAGKITQNSLPFEL